MNISYDAKVDALYIKLISGKHRVETRNIDDDIALNFDERDRLVGVEILDASRRVDLRHLLPVAAVGEGASAHSPTSSTELGNNVWRALRPKLVGLKNAGRPVETLEKRWKNWIVEVGKDYVILRREMGKQRTITITRRQVEGNATRPYILDALRELAHAS